MIFLLGFENTILTDYLSGKVYVEKNFKYVINLEIRKEKKTKIIIKKYKPGLKVYFSGTTFG